MKLALNSILMLIAVGLAWLLYKTIERPIDFETEWNNRENIVCDKLEEIAQLQQMHKGLTGDYAKHFDSLAYVLATDTFFIEKVMGDKYDSTVNVVIKTIPFPAVDSMNAFIQRKHKKNIGIDKYFAEIRKVPFSDKNPDRDAAAEFVILADSADVEGVKDLRQPSFEVSTMVREYMWEFANDSATYVIYDPGFLNSASKNSKRKVGNVNKPANTSGNWSKKTIDKNNIWSREIN